ncbi:MAG TPA: spermidine/putrescine ABC transporter substrate-binding protein [Aestuariivirga sp.]|nr:spermidine/putrescine ABC transporter substrate-binding protein [Aestuariivirga sp.]
MTVHRPFPRFTRRSLLKGTGAAFAGLVLSPRFAMAEEEKKLSFYNYDTYIGETTLDDFNKATGIEVKLDLFADGDELFTKLKAGNPGYDVIVPTSNVVERMVKANMLMPLDHAKIPNMKNIDPSFLNPTFDPGRKYSLPYQWGTVGIGYRKSKVEGAPDSWKWLLDDEKYAGRIALLGDQEHAIGAALKYLGFSYNSTNIDELNKARDLLIKGKKLVKKYADDNGQDLLAQGEVDLTMEYNGDIAQVMTEDDDLSYVIPKEGSNVWEDTIAIPTGAPHPENAHAFINYIFDGEVGKGITKTIMYATPNAAAKALMDEAYQNNPAIFPPADVLAKCEYSAYLGEEAVKVRDEIWTAIQAA